MAEVMQKNKFKILCGGHYYHVRGGSDKYLVELVELLNSQGHAAAPFSVRDERNHPSEYDAYFPKGIDSQRRRAIDALRYIYSSESRKNIEKVLKLYDPDLVHLQIYYGQLTSSILKPIRARGIPIIQTLHEYKLSCPVYTHLSNGKICEKCEGHKFVNAVIGKCKSNSRIMSTVVAAEAAFSRFNGDVALVDHFIAPSNFLKNKMIEHKVVTKDKITTINNYIDAAAITPAKSEGSYVLYFGRLSGEKGVLTLIESAKKSNVPLVIVGTGPLYSQIEKKIELEDLGHISLLGFKSGKELESLIDGCLCTVMPSEWYENMPLSVLESMAFAKPVIGARIGGIPEMIEHNVDGLLFESGNSSELSDAMLKLKNNRPLTKNMGMMARRKMIENFNPTLHMEKLSQVYTSQL